MTAGEKRLLRLARAQLHLASMLEQRLVAEQVQLNAAEESRLATIAALDRVSIAGLAFYAAAMRRLSQVDKDITSRKSVVRDLSSQLLRARSRQDILAERAAELESVRVRENVEEESREIALGMRGKAAGKHHVLK